MQAGKASLRLTVEQTLQLRMRAQGLAPSRSLPSRRGDALVPSVVRAAGGIQAQELPAACLGVRARGAGLRLADVEQARLEGRTVVRTWAMRGTLHLLAAEDLAWLLPLLGPVFIAGDARRRGQLGLDEATARRGVEVIRDRITGRGPQTRKEIAGELAAHGIPSEGQATIHLIALAALEGRICQGPEREGEPAFALLEEWLGRLPAPHPPATALAELARRYLAAFGPAGPGDLAAWSGLGRRVARRAWDLIEPDTLALEVDGNPAWILKERREWLDEPQADSPQVRLLPRFDNYLLGYADRGLALDPRYARRINAGGGIVHAAVLVDGRVLGTWRIQRRKGKVEVSVEPFEELPPALLSGLEAEALDVGRFLGVEATLKVVRRG